MGSGDVSFERVLRGTELVALVACVAAGGDVLGLDVLPEPGLGDGPPPTPQTHPPSHSLITPSSNNILS